LAQLLKEENRSLLSEENKNIGSQIGHTWSQSYQTFFFANTEFFYFFAVKLGHFTVAIFFHL